MKSGYRIHTKLVVEEGEEGRELRNGVKDGLFPAKPQRINYSMSHHMMGMTEKELLDFGEVQASEHRCELPGD